VHADPDLLLAVHCNPDDFERTQRLYLARVGDTVGIDVLPGGESGQLLAPEPPVTIVVEGGQRVVAVIPEQPERHVAKELQARDDRTTLTRVVHQPRSLWRDPLPARRPRPIEIEHDGR